MLSYLYERIDQSYYLRYTVGVSVVVSTIGIITLFLRVQFWGDDGQFIGMMIPDLHFGYTVDELNMFYNILGSDGRMAYIHMAMFDLFPFMPSYAILGGWLLHVLTKCNAITSLTATTTSTTSSSTRTLTYNNHNDGKNQKSFTWTRWLFPTILSLDIIETVPQLFGCQVYPNEILNPNIVSIASIANQLKMILLPSSWSLCMILFLVAYKNHNDNGKRE